MTFVECSHAAFVVADLAETATELADVLGVRWAAVQRLDAAIRTPEGPAESGFRFTYSTPASGACLIELIEARPGTPWALPDDGSRWAFHHLGFYASDLGADAAALTAAGWPWTATKGSGPEVAAFTYHQPPNGPTIELVDPATRPYLEAWLAGDAEALRRRPAVD